MDSDVETNKPTTEQENLLVTGASLENELLAYCQKLVAGEGSAVGVGLTPSVLKTKECALNIH